MKKGLIIVLLCVAFAAAGCFLAFRGVWAAGDTTGLTAQGKGEIKFVPDEAVLYLGIVKKGTEVAKVKAEIDEVVNGVLALADKYGIDKDSFNTDYMMIRKEYTDKGKEKVVEYVLTKNMVVTLHDVENFDNVFVEALALGVTHIHEVEFKVSNLEDRKNGAKDLAVKNARKKAEWHASQLGKKITSIKAIDEREARIVNWYERRAAWDKQPYEMLQYSNISLSSKESETSSSEQMCPPSKRKGEPQIRFAFGQIVITSNVEVTFVVEE